MSHPLSSRTVDIISEIDIESVRADTPGCLKRVHFNNAGAALPPSVVVDAVIAHLTLEADIGSYEAESSCASAVVATRSAVARLLSCELSEVALTTGASEAWWRAFQAVPLQAGDRVLASRAEYNSNAFALLQARARGVRFEIIPDDVDGQLDVEALGSMLDSSVKLVAVTHMPTSGGLVNPVERVGEALAGHQALYLLDACQSVGQRVVDLGEIGCDLATFTGRKFLRGPRGTGGLVVRHGAMERLSDPTFIDSRSADWVAEDRYELRSGAARFELFESSVAARIGLGVAIDYALGIGITAIQRRVVALSELLREKLSRLPAVRVLDRGSELSGIVTFDVHGRDSTELVSDLTKRDINTSLISARTAQLDLGPRGISDGVRASVHYYNTETEVDALVDAVAELAADPGPTVSSDR